jgi:hypothetical protein
MTSTIHIFDEYAMPVEILRDSQRHTKRIQLEKLIFSILKTRYGKFFQDFWTSYFPPVTSKKQIVIVERRIHENLEFILHNAAYFSREGEWSLAIVCSDVNINYVKSIVGEKSVQIVPLFQGNPNGNLAKDEYNQLLQTADFYNHFSAETLCLVEMDCYFRKQIPDSVTTFPFLAAPYAWDFTSMGGGLSFRNRLLMIEICNTFHEKYHCQDLYISDGIKKLGYEIPPIVYVKDILAESILHSDPIGVHQWWTFFHPQIEEANEIFERFMSLDI